MEALGTVMEKIKSDQLLSEEITKGSSAFSLSYKYFGSSSTSTWKESTDEMNILLESSPYYFIIA
jgi:hypothetical protein